MTKPESRLTLITSSHRRSVLAALGALGTALATPAARAQSACPAGKPIRLVIPYAPGGGTDATIRVLAGPMGEMLGQSIVIENRTGGNGSVAAGQKRGRC